MIRLVIETDTNNIIGVKETLAMALERYGDIKIIEVKEIRDEPESFQIPLEPASH